jgi:hypothetical protein
MTTPNGMQMDATCDRFGDAYIRRHIAPFLLKNGVPMTVEEVKIACHNARLKGYSVLPVCSTPDEKGWCCCIGGHE